MLHPYQELIDLLAETPRRLTSLLENVDVPSATGTEHFTRVVAHLAAVEALMRERILRMVAQDTPYFRATDLAVVAESVPSLAEALKRLGQERGETLTTLMTLSLKDWERAAIHETLGEVTVEDLVEELVEHDRRHLEQIERLLAGQETPWPPEPS
ncbi:DinB family protein [Thermomicrobium sp. 4228-Ro]|uniref:DinB family protein n=1 Tax=Thermomicrobium sp. 4228-Ro TaxID=2993937 RepID=UPI0022497380|nr:DinB family protein [Thermomicrobium sp. 4228-Ro]MCX2726997.1 DinB family protein [Thermomicrobium sp. 4228-Ro]